VIIEPSGGSWGQVPLPAGFLETLREVTARRRDCLRARPYLDRLVTDHLVERLFQPERPAAILASLSARRAAKEESFNNRLLGRRREVAEADERLACPSRLVEQA